MSLTIKDIEKARRSEKISIESLVQKIGVSRSSYFNWLTSGIIPDKYYKKAAEAVGIRYEEHTANEANSHYGSLPTIPADPNGKEIPFFDVEVFATISPAMGDVVALRPDTFIRIPMFSQGQFAVQVTGHSILPLGRKLILM